MKSIIFFILVSLCLSITLHEARKKVQHFTQVKARSNPESFKQKLALKLWRLAVNSYCREDRPRERSLVGTAIGATNYAASYLGIQTNLVSTFGYSSIKNKLQADGDFIGIVPAEDIIIMRPEDPSSTDFGYIIKDRQKDEIFVVFKGTTPWVWQDVQVDLNTLSVKFDGSKTAEVHQGFSNSIDRLKQQMIDGIKRLRKANQISQLYVTGHSLGGALAVLGAYYIAKENLPVSAVYTYGQPVVGNQAFNDLWDEMVLQKSNPRSMSSYYRVTYHRDPVPNLPPSNCQLGFNQVHLTFDQQFPEVFYDYGSRFPTTCQNKTDQNCKNNKNLEFFQGAAHLLFSHPNYMGEDAKLDITSCGLIGKTKKKKMNKKLRFNKKGKAHRNH